MKVLLTGAFGRCGTAVTDHLRDSYEFTLLDTAAPPEDAETDRILTADVTDPEAMEEAAAGQDAVVHLAGYPYTDGTWDDVHEPNILGLYTTLEAARRAEVTSVVFASSNHVVGGYEEAHAPELYESGYGLVVDHTDPIRPDSLYGTSKAFGEALGRQYVDQFEYPEQFYALRIGSVRSRSGDHPYADAEQRVEEGDLERDSDAYRKAVARMKATWQSRRDFAHLVDCCLADGSVDFGVFYGVSDNRNRWFDLEHARSTLGYRPQDDGSEWTGPP